MKKIDRYYLYVKENCFVIFLLILFFMLALFSLNGPGMHYDELLFINAALGGEEDIFVHKRIWGIPVLLMPYIGALKAWLYMPIFLIFDVNLYSIRVPMIIIGVITLFLNYIVIKYVFNKNVAIIFMIIIAVNPAVMFHTILDWGPTTLMMFFRILLFIFLFIFITKKNWKYGFFVIIISMVGIFDKANFIWIVIAAITSFSLVYYKNILEEFHFKKNKTIYFSAFFFFIIGLVYISNVINFSENFVTSDFQNRLLYIYNLAKKVISGESVYNFVTDSSLSFSKNYFVIVVISFLVSLIGLYRAWNDNLSFRKPLLVLLIFTIVILIEIFFTKQATGSHHFVVLAPFWMIPIAVGLSNFLETTESWKKYLYHTASVMLIAAIFISNIIIYKQYLNGFYSPLAPRWGHGSEKLASELQHIKTDSIICVDWGIGTILLGMLHKKSKIYDYWPHFTSLKDTNLSYYKDIITLDTVVVVPALGKETFKETRVNFFEQNQKNNWEFKLIKVISDRSGTPWYEIYANKNKYKRINYE